MRTAERFFQKGVLEVAYKRGRKNLKEIIAP